MAYNKNVPNVTNDIAQDLSQMQENYSRLGDLLINQISFPANPDNGQIALVNKRLSIYDATSGLWNGLNFFGFKNRIINGDFQIWQRGTSVTNVPGWAYYTADRWKSGTTSGNYNQEKSTMNGFNSLKTTVNTIPDLSVSTALFLPFYYIFEGSHLYDLAIQQKPVTISFLFRSNVTGAFCVVLRHYRTGTNVNSFVHEFTYPVAGVVQKVVVTIPLNATWGEPPANDNKIGFVLSIAPLGGSSRQTSTLDTWLSGDFYVSVTATNWASVAGNYVEIAQIQLEEGDTATDFEWVPFDVQLFRCMRYYEKSYNYGVYPGALDPNGYVLIDCSGSGTTIYRLVHHFKVPKRARPTITTYSWLSGASGVVVVDGTDRPATIDYVSEKNFRAYHNDSSYVKNWLGFHFIADAEL